MLAEILIFISVLLFCFYKWSISTYQFFDKKNIPYAKPLPLLGNMAKVFFRKTSMFDSVIEFYSKHDSKVYGIFENRNPLIMIKDPEFIKQVTVKDFESFVNHRSLFNDMDGNLFGQSLFAMHDQVWKDMRSTLSPAFTGSKMRLMFQLITKTSEEAVTYLKKQITGNKELDMDMKDYFTRFTNDVIASTAFGLEVNSLTEKDNEFYRMGKKATNFTAWMMIKFFFYGTFKPIMKLFKVKVFDETFSNYFMRLVLDTMKYRSEHGIVRQDMINMLMEARNMGVAKTDESTNVGKSHNREWTDTQIVAQCFLFFFAGFETSSVLMCLCAHELMENPEIQEKLMEEVDAVKERLEGKSVTYEALQGMKYMDMVISETLRKWPAAVALDRQCSKTFILKDENSSIQINQGESIGIPVAGLQRDPQYFPNPMVFDPERFNDENKGNIKPFTYAPFGLGPRNCIGSRFALLEAKAMIFHLLSEFTFQASKKSTIPLTMSASGFQMVPKNGYWLKLVPRA